MNKKRVPIEVGDLCQWRALPTIKSKVISIEPSHFNTDIMIYTLKNGCRFQKNEIRRI